MAISETLRPTASSEADPTVDDAGNGYDGNPTTFAFLHEGSEGDAAIVDYLGFANGSIPPLQRTRATLRVRLAWATVDDFDSLDVATSKNAGGIFRKVVRINHPETFPVVPSDGDWAEYDVTGALGTALPSNVRVRLQFGNGALGNGPPELEVS